MDHAFMGLGLKNIVGLFILFMVMIVIIKVSVLKTDKVPEGAKNFVLTI